MNENENYFENIFDNGITVREDSITRFGWLLHSDPLNLLLKSFSNLNVNFSQQPTESPNLNYKAPSNEQKIAS